MNRREALAALVSLPATARISVAQLKPDDVIVIECAERLTRENLERLERTAQSVWPGRKVAVLAKGFTLKVVSGT
jgi:hypothetical protein